jgi:hypothetical protein
MCVETDVFSAGVKELIKNKIPDRGGKADITDNEPD